MPELFHYDYHSLSDVEVDRWHDAFFWPVSRETTHQLIHDLAGEQYRMIHALGETFAGDCFLIAYGIPFQIARVLNHFLAIHRIAQKGYAIVHSPKLKIIPALLGQEGSLCFRPASISADPLLRRKIKAIHFYQSIRYNYRKSNFRLKDHFTPNRTIFSYSHDYVLNRFYTQQIASWIRITSPEEWYAPPAPPIEKDVLATLHDIAEEYLAFITTYMTDRFLVDLPENICVAIRHFIVQDLREIAQIYAVFLKTTQKAPRRLFTATGGKVLTRALSLATRKNGGTVTGFSHGYYICHSTIPRPYMHEFATVDNFLCYTPATLPLLEEYVKIHPPPRNNPVNFIHENTPLFQRIWNQYQNTPLAEKIESIMVVELGLLLEDARLETPDSLVIYHFYYQLCRFLTQKGYRVYFKRRPKAYDWENINIFKQLENFCVLYEPFEETEVLQKVDAVVVQYALSSTMIYAMCTNKTVIYVDAGWESWFPDVYNLMAKRCRILNCWYDDRNRQCFDEKELLDLLAEKPAPPNTEFLETYLFPTAEEPHNFK